MQTPWIILAKKKQQEKKNLFIAHAKSLPQSGQVAEKGRQQIPFYRLPFLKSGAYQLSILRPFKSMLLTVGLRQKKRQTSL